MLDCRQVSCSATPAVQQIHILTEMLRGGQDSGSEILGHLVGGGKKGGNPPPSLHYLLRILVNILNKVSRMYENTVANPLTQGNKEGT